MYACTYVCMYVGICRSDCCLTLYLYIGSFTILISKLLETQSCYHYQLFSLISWG